MVAGVMQDDLLTGFREAIDKAIAKGTTLAEFREDFDRLVAAHGWSYHGTPGWRSKVIYETNLRTSSMSGQWEEAQRVKEARPYGRYVAVQDQRTRPEHKAWHDMIVPLDDPWWDTHWPPNGWGCRCTVITVSDYDLRQSGESVSKPPPDKPYTVNLRGPDGPVPVQTVAGIDPGWAYNCGKASSGARVSEAAKQAMDDADTWEKRTRLTQGDYTTYGLPGTLPEREAKAGMEVKAKDTAAAERILYNILGGPEKLFTGADGMPVLVSAVVLARHHWDRSPYYPFIPELIEDPEEIWLTLDRHDATGRVELRKRYIKKVRIGSTQQGFYLVAQVVKGQVVIWTFVDASSPSVLNNQRKGKLIWSRD